MISYMGMGKKYRLKNLGDIIIITLVMCAFPRIYQNLYRLQNSPKRFWEIIGKADIVSSAQAGGTALIKISLTG